MIWGPGGSKSRLAKAAGAEPAGQMRDEKLHAVVAHICKSKCTKHLGLGALLEVGMSKKFKMYKTHHVRTTFGSCDVEKVHAVVARSTFRSQNVQNTPCTDHFWRFRCRKSARRCGAKHISKSKCTKHTMYGPFLEAQMSFRVAGARDCGPCQKWAKREGFVAFSTTTTSAPHYTPIHYTTLQLQLQLHLHYILLHYTPHTTLHSITLNYTTLHYITLHYTTLHYLPLHYTTLHYITLHYTTLHYLPLHCITLHYTPLHYTSLHYTTTTTAQLHSATLRYTKLHNTKLHYTTLHCTTLHYTALHYRTLHYTTFHYTALHYTTLHSTTLQLQLRLHNYTPLH